MSAKFEESKKAIQELGLSTYSIEETLKETGESYKRLGLL